MSQIAKQRYLKRRPCHATVREQIAATLVRDGGVLDQNSFHPRIWWRVFRFLQGSGKSGAKRR